MVSNFPQLFVARDQCPAGPEQAPPAERLGDRVLDRIREAFCGLHGHDNLLQFEQDRLCLKCVSCGHESPGWELNEVPPHVVARAEPRHRALAHPQLIRERRIA
jgi:hypothetical protein